jgi:hypothetical protein
MARRVKILVEGDDGELHEVYDDVTRSASWALVPDNPVNNIVISLLGGDAKMQVEGIAQQLHAVCELTGVGDFNTALSAFAGFFAEVFMGEQDVHYRFTTPEATEEGVRGFKLHNGKPLMA